MILKNISIKNFRNINLINYKPGSNLNILMGDNAQGKTNILEAIFAVATGSSFRTSKFLNLLKYDAKNLIINTEHLYNDRLIRSTLSFEQKSKKVLKINNKRSPYNNPDRLRVVLFTPDDLYLVKGNPSKRRDFLDFILKQLSGDYLYNFNNYVNTLKKRNLLLKSEQAKNKSFEIISDIFIENAARVIIARINFVNILDELVRIIYQETSISNSDLKIRYALSFPVDSDKISLDILKDSFKKHIYNNLNMEIKRKTSLYGPHLDDINIYNNGRLARFFSSQGEQRNIAVILKLAEMYSFKKIKNYYPIFLLDEVLAELDEERKKSLLNHLLNADFQSFLTSVNSSNLRELKNNIMIVKEGCLSGKE